MLSNKMPNLEAKMEKGISNNQKGGDGSTLAAPHVFYERQPLEINCSFYSSHCTSHHHCTGERAPVGGCFKQWLVVRREKTRFPLRAGWVQQPPLASAVVNHESGKGRLCSLTSSPTDTACCQVTAAPEAGFIRTPKPQRKRGSFILRPS